MERSDQTSETPKQSRLSVQIDLLNATGCLSLCHSALMQPNQVLCAWKGHKFKKSNTYFLNVGLMYFDS